VAKRITRRSAAKLLLGAPIALALPAALDGAAARKPVGTRLSPAERRQFEKTVGQLRESAGKLRRMTIPMGAEPAFVFRPLLPKK